MTGEGGGEAIEAGQLDVTFILAHRARLSIKIAAPCWQPWLCRQYAVYAVRMQTVATIDRNKRPFAA